MGRVMAMLLGVGVTDGPLTDPWWAVLAISVVALIVMGCVWAASKIDE